jgi:hypothetical protein
VSAFIPRPIDFESTGNRVKNVNKKLVLLCKSRKVYEYHAIKDEGLHLNLEGTRRSKEFVINNIAHLK